MQSGGDALIIINMIARAFGFLKENIKGNIISSGICRSNQFLFPNIPTSPIND
jgi:hypothetical protein